MLFLGSVRVSGISSVALTAMLGCLQLANGQGCVFVCVCEWEFMLASVQLEFCALL